MAKMNLLTPRASLLCDLLASVGRLVLCWVLKFADICNLEIHVTQCCCSCRKHRNCSLQARSNPGSGQWGEGGDLFLLQKNIRSMNITTFHYAVGMRGNLNANRKNSLRLCCWHCTLRLCRGYGWRTTEVCDSPLDGRKTHHSIGTKTFLNYCSSF